MGCHGVNNFGKCVTLTQNADHEENELLPVQKVDIKNFGVTESLFLFQEPEVYNRITLRGISPKRSSKS